MSAHLVLAERFLSAAQERDWRLWRTSMPRPRLVRSGSWRLGQASDQHRTWSAG